jgi:hypothetical protein
LAALGFFDGTENASKTGSLSDATRSRFGVERKEESLSRLATSEIRTPKRDDPIASVEGVVATIVLRWPIADAGPSFPIQVQNDL